RTEELFARMPKARFVDVWRATTAFVTPPPRPHRLGVPLALLRGEKDDTGNIATAMPRWAAAEGIDEYVIPNAGHVVTWDAPEETEAAVMEILEVWRGAGAAQADDV